MTATIQQFPIRKIEADWRKSDLVGQLHHSREASHNIRHRGRVHELPSRESLQLILKRLCCALFPTHFGQAVFANDGIDFYVANCLQEALPAMTIQVQRSLQFDLVDVQLSCNISLRAEAIVDGFAARLPAIRNMLVEDFRAAYRGDPAAENVAEVVLAYRGSIAIIYHRLAHELYQRGVHFVARMISDLGNL